MSDAHKLYESLRQDAYGLHRSWGMLQTLYGDKATLADLNRHTGQFFALLQVMLVNDLVTRLCRLLDPPGADGKKNVSVRRLSEVVAMAGQGELADEISKALRAESKLEKRVRAQRSKALAHRCEAALVDKTKELDPVLYSDIETLIGVITAALKRVEVSLWDSDTHYVGAQDLGGAREIRAAVTRACEGWESDEVRWRAGDEETAGRHST